jgi:membrane protein DedA with SNARE-associated domain
LIETLTSHFVEWLLVAPALVCFAGSFIGGTVVILVIATFAGSADVPWWWLLAGAFLGNFASDIGWFALARSRVADRIRGSEHFAAQRERTQRLNEITRKRDWLLFIAIKFAYGLRIAQILLLGAVHYPWPRFLKLDGLAVLVINTAAVLSGWMVGRGVTRYFDWFENTGRLISAIALLVAVYLAGRWAINRYMLKWR